MYPEYFVSGEFVGTAAVFGSDIPLPPKQEGDEPEHEALRDVGLVDPKLYGCLHNQL